MSSVPEPDAVHLVSDRGPRTPLQDSPFDGGAASEDEVEIEEIHRSDVDRRSGLFPQVNILLRVAELDIDGDIGINSRSVVQATSSTDALGLEEETAFLPRVDLDWSVLHLSFAALDVEYEGDGVAQATIDFGDGGGITVGTPVRTEVDFGLATGNLYVDILPSSIMDLGIGFGAGVVEADANFTALMGTAFARTENTYPFGYLSVRASKQLGPLELIGTASGISVEFNDDEVEFYEFDVTGRLRFLNTRFMEGSIVGGYHWVGVDVEIDERGGTVDIDLDLDGPFVGLSLVF